MLVANKLLAFLRTTLLSNICSRWATGSRRPSCLLQACFPLAAPHANVGCPKTEFAPEFFATLFGRVIWHCCQRMDRKGCPSATLWRTMQTTHCTSSLQRRFGMPAPRTTMWTFSPLQTSPHHDMAPPAFQPSSPARSLLFLIHSLHSTLALPDK